MLILNRSFFFDTKDYCKAPAIKQKLRGIAGTGNSHHPDELAFLVKSNSTSRQFQWALSTLNKEVKQWLYEFPQPLDFKELLKEPEW